MDITNFKRNTAESDEDSWAEWLSDTPNPVDDSEGHRAGSGSRRAHIASNDGFKTSKMARTKAIAKSNQGSDDGAKTIAIQIHMPELHLPKWNIPWKQLRPWLIGVSIAAFLILGGKILINRPIGNTTGTKSLPTNVQAAVDLGYKPLVPSVRPEGESQPSAPLYDSSKSVRVYTFTDTYMGANIWVSQQALPDEFRDEKAVHDFAYGKDINATESFTTTLGRVYLYTDKQSGAQRMVLTNKKMLMFIQSTLKLDTATWVEYIQNLQ